MFIRFLIYRLNIRNSIFNYELRPSINNYCYNLPKVLCDTFPWIMPLYEGTLENRKHWKDLAEKVEMGLTWIDHDKIEIPVEEFFSKSESIKKKIVDCVL